MYTDIPITSLVIKAQSGDRRAFSKLYSLTYRKQYCMALGYLKNEHLAQDAVQTAYLNAIENIHRLQDPSKFNSWLGQITYHESMDLLNAKEKPVITSEEEAEYRLCIDAGDNTNPINQIVQEEEKAALLKHIQLLSHEHQRIILLRYYKGLKLGEIAKLTNTSVGTVKSRLHYAKKQLLNILEKQGYTKGAMHPAFGIILSQLLRKSPEAMPLSVKEEKKLETSRTLKMACLMILTGLILIGAGGIINFRPDTSAHTVSAEVPPYESSLYCTRSAQITHVFLPDMPPNILILAWEARTISGQPVKVLSADWRNRRIDLPYLEKETISLTVHYFPVGTETYLVEPETGI